MSSSNFSSSMSNPPNPSERLMGAGGLVHDALSPVSPDAVYLGLQCPRSPYGGLTGALFADDDAVRSSSVCFHAVADVRFPDGPETEISGLYTGNLQRPLLVTQPGTTIPNGFVGTGPHYEGDGPNAYYSTPRGFQPSNDVTSLTIPANNPDTIWGSGTIFAADNTVPINSKTSGDLASAYWEVQSADMEAGAASLTLQTSRNLEVNDSFVAYLESTNDVLDGNETWSTRRTYNFNASASKTQTVAGSGIGNQNNITAMRLRCVFNPTREVSVKAMNFGSNDWNLESVTTESSETDVIDFGSQLDDLNRLADRVRVTARSLCVSYIGGANVSGTGVGAWTKGNQEMQSMGYNQLSTVNDMFPFTRKDGYHTYAKPFANDGIWRNDISDSLSENMCRFVCKADLPAGYAASIRFIVQFRVQFTTTSVLFSDLAGISYMEPESHAILMSIIEMHPNCSCNPDHAKAIAYRVKDLYRKYGPKLVKAGRGIAKVTPKIMEAAAALAPLLLL